MQPSGEQIEIAFTEQHANAIHGLVSVGRCVVRLVGLVLAIVPLFAGFVPVLFSEWRRRLPDFLAGTVVAYDAHP